MVNNLREFRVLDEFDEEAQEIYNYLKDRSPQAAEKFRSKVREKLEQIQSNPFAFAAEPELPSKRKIYRKAIVMKSRKIVYRILQIRNLRF